MKNQSLTQVFVLSLLFSACVQQKESGLVFSNMKSSAAREQAVQVQPISVEPILMDKFQFNDNLRNVFAPRLPAMESSGDANYQRLVMNLDRLTFMHIANNFKTLEEGCDGYATMPSPGLRSRYDDTWYGAGCANVNAGIVGDNTASKTGTPLAKNDVYTRMSKIRICEVLSSGNSSSTLPVSGIASHNKRFLALAFHKTFRTENDPFSYDYVPDFTQENILKVIKVFYPTMENLEESAEILFEIDGAFAPTQKLEKWKAVYSGVCQSMFWEML